MLQCVRVIDVLKGTRAVSLVLMLAALATAGTAQAGTRFSEPAVFDAEHDGANSQSALVVGADGAMYGTTEFGGKHNLGTVFRFVPGQGIEAVHHFSGKTGARSRAGLLRLPDGSLWGVAGFGGAHDLGTVFRLLPNGKVKLVHSFDGVDGEYPLARLTLGRDGLVYGTTTGMSDAYAGSVFRIDPATGAFTLLHRFEGDKNSAPLGHSPSGRLLQAADGYFYGTAYKGGDKGQGTIYRLDPASGAVALAHAFQQGEGCHPYAGLTEGTGGDFYGVATGCGDGGSGTVFRVKLKGGQANIQPMHHFDWFNEASNPICDLTLASDGYLYGCAHDVGYGSAFRIRPNGEGYNRFLLAGWRTPSKGWFPWGQMLEHESALWGTLALGVDTQYNAGTIYRLTTTAHQP